MNFYFSEEHWEVFFFDIFYIQLLYPLIHDFILQRKMDDFETITGKVNNAEKPYPPPSRESSVLGNWKENGNDNSPSPKHPGKANNLFSIIFKSIGSSFDMRLQMLYSILSWLIRFITI